MLAVLRSEFVAVFSLLGVKRVCISIGWSVAVEWTVSSWSGYSNVGI